MNHDEFCPNQNYITLFYKTTVNFKCRDENVFLKFLTFCAMDKSRIWYRLIVC